MPTQTDEATNFLHGLSDLWNRFFKDRKQLEAMYKADEILIGQAYLDLLQNVLNLSIRNTPVFGRDFFRMLTIREDRVTKQPNGWFGFDLTPLGIKGIEFLQNKVLSPTVILERGLDFQIDIDGDQDLLLFAKDPFDWQGDGSGLTVPGVAYRTVEILQDNGSTTLVRELAFWAPDCQRDDFGLYLNFGYLIQRFEPSSEAYRALIQGVVRYFVLGPSAGILTSALNVVAGLPVIRDDDEYLLEVTSTDYARTVVTSARSYEFDAAIPLRDDVLDPDNWSARVGKGQALQFHSFEHLSKLFQVYDALNNYSWWYEKEIPASLMPQEPKARRLISPILYENLINYPEGVVKVGDPGVFIGADDDGFVPTGRPSFRHLFSYLVFSSFLKSHAFVLEIDKHALVSGTIPFERLSADLQGIVLAGKSAYTYLFTEQDIPLVDEIIPSESLRSLLVSPSVGDTVVGIPNEVVLGGGLLVGDYYQYASNSLTIGNPWTGWGDDGKTPIVIGGADPRNFVQTQIEDGVSKHGDWPVQIQVSSV